MKSSRQMTPVQKFTKFLPMLFLLAAWLLFGCGSFASLARPLSEPEILATADAIRAMTPVVTPFPTRDRCEHPDEDVAQDCMLEDDADIAAAEEKFGNEQATNEASVRIDMANDQATQMVQE